MPACDGLTDRQTDGRTGDRLAVGHDDSMYRANIASGGKNDLNQYTVDTVTTKIIVAVVFNNWQ